VTQKAATRKAATSKAATSKAADGQAADGQAATERLMAPPMPWSMDNREAAALRSLPGIHSVERLHPPRGRGVLHSYVLPLADRLPLLRSLVLSIWSVRFE